MVKITSIFRQILLLVIPLFFTFCGNEKKAETNETGIDAQVVASTVSVKEWPVPWENSGTRDPYVAPDGKVWFCGQGGNYIAHLDSASGDFKRYELETGTHPHNLIVDKEGFVWYAGNRNAHIGKLNPADGSIVKYPMPDPLAQDPHTLVFNREGNIWFTVQFGNFIGHLDTQSGEVKLVTVPTAKARPYGIKMDRENRPWVVLFGTNKLATVDPATFELSEIEIPDEDARPRRIEISSNGNVFYVDYAGGFIGRYEPAVEKFSRWPLPGGPGAQPYGTAKDAGDRIWIAESGVNPNRLVGFDPVKEAFFSLTEIPSGGGTIRHMYFHEPSGEIWFGTDTNNIGRASVDL